MDKKSFFILSVILAYPLAYVANEFIPILPPKSGPDFVKLIKFKNKFPAKIGATLQLNDVSAPSDEEVNYLVTLIGESSLSPSFAKSIKDQFTKTFCTGSGIEQLMLGQGLTVRYVFKTEDARESADVTIKQSDCI